jgi:hypothetical protein
MGVGHERLSRDRKGVVMGVRATKDDEDALVQHRRINGVGRDGNGVRRRRI